MRGQASLEYVMTYGWAILALVIVLAALFATGVFSPSYLVSEECSFGNNLKCNLALFNDGGHTRILVTVFNGFPYKINVTGFELASAEGSQQFSGFANGVIIESGENRTFEGTLGGPPVPEGSVKRFVGNATYVSCAPELGPSCSTVEHVVSGRVTGRLIPE